MIEWICLYCLIHSNKPEYVATFLREEYFDELPKRVYFYILELIDKNIKITPELVKSHFTEEINIDFDIDVTNWQEYVNNLRKLYVNQSIKNLGKAISKKKEIDEESFINYVDNFLNTVLINKKDDLHYADEISQKFYDESQSSEEITSDIKYGIKSMDEFTGGLTRGEYITIAGRPSMGKSALAAHVAMINALNNKVVVFFSLEMSAKRLINRMFGDACNVELWKFKKLTNRSKEDQERFGAILSMFKEMPLIIDTTSVLEIETIKSIIQKIKMKYKRIDLIVVDYLQLMEGAGESKNIEISNMSRKLKGIATQYNIPVVIVSQLSRLCEMRDNKRPILSDLRDSGCLTKDTLILMSTGEYKSIEDIMLDKIKYNSIWSINESLKIEKDKIINVFSTGKKSIFSLETYTGKKIKATSNHPFLTIDGWKSLEELKPQDRIAVPRLIPIEKSSTNWENNKLIFLAHMIGDGTFIKKWGIGYCNTNEEQIKLVAKASEIFDIIPKYEWQSNAKTYQLRFTAKFKPSKKNHNPVISWLTELNLLNKYSHEKFIPSSIFLLENNQIALFLNHLWMTDGCIVINKNNKISLYYASNSKRLVFDVQSLLLKLGVLSKIYTVPQNKNGKIYKDMYHLSIENGKDQIKFLSYWDYNLPKGETAKRVMELLLLLKKDTNVDTIPKNIWNYIKYQLKDKKISHRNYCKEMNKKHNGSAMFCFSPSREYLKKISNILNDNHLKELSNSDVFWDKIKSITPIGEEETYDITTNKNHNFIANNIIVHNSIEQDSDVVIMTYRDHYYNYNPENERICELAIRKNRNGETGKIIVDYNLKTQHWDSINPNSALGKIAKRFEYE